MKRRAFTTTLLGAGAAALAAPRFSQAQGVPVEGKHYVRLSQPVPTTAGSDKIEVVEFFRYGCPHCAAFEPEIGSWARNLPADVSFKVVPVSFGNESFVAHQRLFYALEVAGLIPTLHRKVFYVIHNERQRLDNPAEISAFLTKNGADAAKVMEAYNSFGMQTKLRQANQLVDGYKIDGVPAIGLQGRFYTSGALAGDNTRALAVADYLLQTLRKKAS
jgi:protein dithiol oxidoreductase (disulfide-forming)